METYTKDGVTIVAISDENCKRTCRECYFRGDPDYNGCDIDKLKQWDIPDCVLDRKRGESVIYIEQK